MKTEIIEAIEKYKIITIVRGVSAEKLVPLSEALYDGGIRLVEITFDAEGRTPDEETAEMISSLVGHFGGRMYIGAGTVLTPSQVVLAHKAGAGYIISPDTSEEVIRKTKELGMVSIPGAMTPTEITTAYRYGADFVKIFPAGDLGVAYVRSVITPLKHIPVLAVAGVTADKLGDFLKAGVKGFGISSSIVDKTLLANGDFAGITELARRFTSQI